MPRGKKKAIEAVEPVVEPEPKKRTKRARSVPGDEEKLKVEELKIKSPPRTRNVKSSSAKKDKLIEICKEEIKVEVNLNKSPNYYKDDLAVIFKINESLEKECAKHDESAKEILDKKENENVALEEPKEKVLPVEIVEQPENNKKMENKTNSIKEITSED